MIQYITHADVLRHTIARRWPSLFIKKQKKLLQAHECCKNRITLPSYIRSCLNFFQDIIYIASKKCLSFYALFCLFFSFSQLHSPLCAFEK